MIYDAAVEMGMSDQQVMAAAGNAWPVPVVAKLVKEIKAAMEWQ